MSVVGDMLLAAMAAKMGLTIEDVKRCAVGVRTMAESNTASQLEQRFQVEEVDILKPVGLRVTDLRYPDAMMPLGNARYWFIYVTNGLDAEITVELQGSPDNDRRAPNLGASQVIAAGTPEPIATNLWAPWVGINVTPSAAPTSGEVRIRGLKQIEFVG